MFKLFPTRSFARSLLISLSVALLFTSAGIASDDDDWDDGMMLMGAPLELELGVGYESKYVDDGLQEIDHGIFATEIEAELEFDLAEVFFEIEALSGSAGSDNLTEIELVLGVERELFNGLEGYIGYSWENESPTERGENVVSNELLLGFAYNVAGIELDLGLTQSLDYSGSLYHVTAERTMGFDLFGIPVDVTPSVGVFYDDDYVFGDEDVGGSGLNHIQASISAATEIADDIALGVALSHVWVQENLYEQKRSGEDDDGGDDGTGMAGADDDDDDDDDDEEIKARNDFWFGIFLSTEF